MTTDTAPASDTGVPAKENPQTSNPAPKQEPGSVPYSRFAEVVEQRKAAEAALEAVVAELAQDVPEDMRDLIPAGLPAAERAAWIRTAKAKGLFTVPAPASSPDAKRPTGKPIEDLSGLSPLAKLQRAYGK